MADRRCDSCSAAASILRAARSSTLLLRSASASATTVVIFSMRRSKNAAASSARASSSMRTLRIRSSSQAAVAAWRAAILRSFSFRKRATARRSRVRLAASAEANNLRASLFSAARCSAAFTNKVSAAKAAASAARARSSLKARSAAKRRLRSSLRRFSKSASSFSRFFTPSRMSSSSSQLIALSKSSSNSSPAASSSDWWGVAGFDGECTNLGGLEARSAADDLLGEAMRVRSFSNARFGDWGGVSDGSSSSSSQKSSLPDASSLPMTSKSSSPPFLSVRLFPYLCRTCSRSLLTRTNSLLKSVLAAPSKMRCLRRVLSWLRRLDNNATPPAASFASSTQACAIAAHRPELAAQASAAERARAALRASRSLCIARVSSASARCRNKDARFVASSRAFASLCNRFASSAFLTASASSSRSSVAFQARLRSTGGTGGGSSSPPKKASSMNDSVGDFGASCSRRSARLCFRSSSRAFAVSRSAATAAACAASRCGPKANTSVNGLSS
mmetsp:Transcript_22256/g.62630  ORF Transcript_22256/g.62630 Transcript_22256/m.62630 type:complete len:505 (-) Transcript_22256:686-2200(-)